MTPEEKSLLERTLKLSEENNAILKGLRRSNRTAMAVRVLYWAVIIALSFGAYYFIQPYFNVLAGLLDSSSPNAASQAAPTSVQDAAASLKQLLQKSP